MCLQLRFQLIATIGILLGVFSSTAQSLWPNLEGKCSGTGSSLKYLSGDALLDSANCIGPNNVPYPSSTISRAFSGGSSRKGRQSHLPTTVDPMVMQSTLLQVYREVNDDQSGARHGEFHPKTRAESSRMESCVPLEIARRKSLSTDQLLREIFFFFQMWKSHHPAKNSYRSYSICVFKFLFFRRRFNNFIPKKCVKLSAENDSQRRVKLIAFTIVKFN